MKEQKDLEYYLALNYPYTIEEEEEDGKKVYVVEIPDLPGCGAQGTTLEEARRNLEEAKAIWIEESWKRKLTIPEPSKEFSGRILLRIPPTLHGQLNKHARQAGLSLNQFIRNLLETKLDLSKISERLDRIEQEIHASRESPKVWLTPITTTWFTGYAFAASQYAVTVDDSKITGTRLPKSKLHQISAGCIELPDKEEKELAA
jgi:antitoxin HicB